jgi:branched-chain amino acid aminotransferase
MRKVWMNGKIIDETEAKISVYDSALMYGDMVFEMTRSFEKKQFKLKEHIDRLYYGLKILRIPIDLSKSQMEKHCYETIEANENLFNEDDEHRLMIDVSRGLLGIYHRIEGLHKGPNIIITDFPLRWTVSNMGHLFDTGINAVITSQRAIPQSLMDPKIKNRSRLFYLMANIEASQMKGKDNWALLLDESGFISEGTGDNFFIIKDNKVISPEGHDILRGISREYVMKELCPQIGIECIEAKISAYDVYTADEAFMTGTPFCMLPVTKLNGLEIGDGKVGNVFNRILNKWSENSGVNIKKQIKTWNQIDGEYLNEAPTPYNFDPKKNK